MSADLAVFWSIVLLRVLIPLAIPRYPLPGIIAALVLDAIDQTLFQTFTNLQLDGYQGYDKALDIYYLAIAYIATLRNWINVTAFHISRFLFYYRLVGIVLFEITEIRWLLLVFPNVFEYFFIFYEVVQLRWNPLRLRERSLLSAAAVIWIGIKLPQEFWIHVAQLDVTDVLKVNVLGYPPTTSWGTILALSPWLPFLAAGALAAVAYAGWRWLRPRLPAADWPVSWTPDTHVAPVPNEQLRRTMKTMAIRLVDQELLEKTVLVSLLVVIFAHILPGIRSSDLELALAVTVVVVVNTVVSEAMVRRGVSWRHALQQGAVMVGVNLPVMVVLSLLRYGSIPPVAFTNIVVFILLLSLIITLYDRYRPVCLVRILHTA